MVSKTVESAIYYLYRGARLVGNLLPNRMPTPPDVPNEVCPSCKDEMLHSLFYLKRHKLLDHLKRKPSHWYFIAGYSCQNIHPFIWGFIRWWDGSEWGDLHPIHLGQFRL